jgi:hypothetical protein
MRVLAAAVTLATLVGLAGSASATWVRPPVGELRDVAGVEAGCQVSIEAPEPPGPPSGWKGSRAWFTVDSGLVCEDTWGR